MPTLPIQDNDTEYITACVEIRATKELINFFKKTLKTVDKYSWTHSRYYKRRRK